MAESWRSRKTLILGRTDMIGLLSPAEYVDRVEHAFRMHGLGRVYMEPKGHIVLDRYKGEWEVMPSYIEEPEAAACKWVSIREDNAKYDLPAVFSILIYTHPETGFPLAICDGSFHTLMRTGASAAVSAKWLARKDSKALAILGTGSVGEGTLATCDTVFAWEDVRIWSRTQASVDRFLASEAPKYPHLRLVGTTDVRKAVEGADVLVTGTHEGGVEVVNTLYDVRRVVREDRWQRLPGSYHGSGCTLASAIAALLARGLAVERAVRQAQEYTWKALAAGFSPGHGQAIPDRFFESR
jgi:ornithine cyclodeaminase/alanine dehydrogenase-like protein (mu-crystallin family)